MMIHEMSREECLQVLAEGRLARLACAHENQPYVVPVYLAYHGASGCLYGFTTPGQKVEWMRANPMVCVEVDEVVTDDRWRSVIATGHYEELPKTSGSNGARPRAQEYSRQIVEARPAWPADSCQRQCDDEECDAERELAYQVLKTQPMWWQTSWAAFSARADRDPAEPYLPVYYRIRIDRVTGHEATRDARDAISYAVPSSSGRWGWLRKTLTRVFGDRSKEAGSAS